MDEAGAARRGAVLRRGEAATRRPDACRAPGRSQWLATKKETAVVSFVRDAATFTSENGLEFATKMTTAVSFSVAERTRGEPGKRRPEAGVHLRSSCPTC